MLKSILWDYTLTTCSRLAKLIPQLSIQILEISMFYKITKVSRNLPENSSDKDECEH